MRVRVFATAGLAGRAAADRLAGILMAPGARNLVVAGGNSPLDLYRRMARRRLDAPRLEVYMLDEYVGVPESELRNCANLLKREVADAWRLPHGRFHAISSAPDRALESVLAHERKILDSGGVDAIVLGLGADGHLGFNEPGSSPLSTARLLPLEISSIEANRRWFGGDFAPDHGVTIGLKTILTARNILLLAFGPFKSGPVRSMLEGPIQAGCPASWLRLAAGEVDVFLDAPAASGLSRPGAAG